MIPKCQERGKNEKHASSIMLECSLFIHQCQYFQVNAIPALSMNIQVGETVEAQYVSVEDEEQLTEVPEESLHDNGNHSNSDKQTVDTNQPTCFHMNFVTRL